MRKRNIAIDARVWRIEAGGIARYVQSLVKELVAQDPGTTYTLIINKEDAKHVTLKAPNLKLLKVQIPQYSLAEQREFLHILNREAFDLVHFTNFNHPIGYKGKFVVTIHDLIMHLFPSGAQTKSLVRKLAYRLIMRHTKRAQRIIVPSEATSRDCQQLLGMKPSTLRVIPHGSPPEHPPLTQAALQQVREALGIKGDFILFVSRWERYKGLDALLEAFALLHQTHPDITLVICGKPMPTSPDVSEMVALAKAADLPICTPGFVSDLELSALYQTASVYIHPSRYEGFGLMILEAFAAGAPVVTSNLSCLPEVAGDAATLVNPNNPAEITEAIREILDNPEKASAMRKAGKQRAKEYSWEKTAAETLAIYNESTRS